ncbi:fasciclin domain-containing protein [uncultured Mucilaginibacter sp.]|uniref:fasciclin domain-containing protein n=1 Tax=uncultured Mucilaginibacter sp. TaxID=797541 RepID=UPI0025F2E6FA|nr:fasciclin domain-containing protein [uncultured Mucilaginibacter sp.]
MKYLILFITTILSVTASAQTIPTRGSSYQDSVRASAAEGKVIMVNGEPVNKAMDFIENLTASKSNTIFLNALRVSGMYGTLKSRGPLTLLLPADDDLKQQLGARLDTLMKPTHKYELVNFLSYHILPGRYTSKDLLKLIKDAHGTATILTLAGSKLTATVNENRNIILTDNTGGKSVIGLFDVEESNGIMHTLSKCLIPQDRAL